MRYFILLIATFLFAGICNVSAQTDTDEWVYEVTLPADFMQKLFRPSEDNYLIAWHGSVKLRSMATMVGDSTAQGSIDQIVPQLNQGLNELFGRYFEYNMKDGMAHVVGPDNTIWVARCGLKAGSNFNISPTTGEEMGVLGGNIISEVQASNYSLKAVATNSHTTEKDRIEIYLQINSIYYYDRDFNDLAGTVEREDGYKLCGDVEFERLGPKADLLRETAEVEGIKFQFRKQLVRGEYEVNYVFPNGDKILLEEDFLYNPTGRNKEVPEWTIKGLEADILGRVVLASDQLQDSRQGLPNYEVKIEPICRESGLPTRTTTTNQYGEYKFEQMPMGEYQVVVKGAPNVNAFHTKPKKNVLKVNDSEVSIPFDVTLTFSAPNFYAAKVVWPNTIIRFPKKGEAIPKIILTRESAEDFSGDDIMPPVTTYLGKKKMGTFFNKNQDDYGKPELISANPTGSRYSSIHMAQEEDSPHMFIIARNAIGEIPGVINMRMQVDFTCKIEEKGREQNIFTVDGNSPLNHSPDYFRWEVFDADIIQKIQQGKYAKKELTNGLGGKATIEFKPALK